MGGADFFTGYSGPPFNGVELGERQALKLVGDAGHEGGPLDSPGVPLVGELLDRLSVANGSLGGLVSGVEGAFPLLLLLLHLNLGRPALGNRYDLVGAALGHLTVPLQELRRRSRRTLSKPPTAKG